ncbi:flagellar hook protein FlgE [Pseudogemmobacter blasticus]|uniref:Flagellar hook protein FlgE n=1 Tax=Fuscovulum blasticum DSM 2131 TaxID=1188250 RepID=A0A2T4JEZ6_FUSBL|nr:flagellar hook-basal body complex protein [Fuscovulum blasticum]AWD22129.1 flagellar biosynthesis protein FlgE [Fuscovulum blasticum]PTE16479.1 flagellar biosynthesis protein FlgE [Fuscovulum blasticum DSM 2131]
MTISSALSAGVAGLNANATRLATISDNIANSGTYGYKRSSAEFDSMVITNARGAGVYSAGGVRASTLRLIEERGALVGTSNALDLAVAGRGMLPVIPEVSLGNITGDTPLLMTRTGAFRTDADGILKTESGMVLLGWPANPDGTIPVMPRDTITGLEPVVINSNQTAGDPTTTMTLGVNLPATGTEAGAAGTSLPLSVEYFGNLGTSETLDITFTPTVPATGTSNTWTMVITDSASGGAEIGRYTLTFDDSRSSGGTLENVSQTAGWPGGTYNAATGRIDLTVAGGPISVAIGRLGDPNGLTQLSDKFAPVRITKDGSPVGNLTTVEVDENGYITATYDTGFTRRLYQIPLVDVPNPNGLLSLNNQTYQVSPKSGSFFLWDAGDGPTGSVEGYAREGSTTDVAAELTSLIQTQRAYSSNAKVIQTVDEMLQETTNIKR